MVDFYKTIFEQMDTAALILKDESVLHANRAYLERFRIEDISVFVGEDPVSVLLGDDLAGGSQDPQKVTDQEGREVPVRLSWSLIDLAENIRLLQIEILDDKDLYQEINMLSAYNRELFDKALHPIVFMDKNERVLDVNREFERVFAYNKEEVINREINDLIVPSTHLKESREMRERVLQSRTQTLKTERRNKSGELIQVEAAACPVVVNGEVAGLFAMYRDRRVEEKALLDLKKEKAYFKQLFDNSPDAITLLDDQDRIIDFNRSFEKMFGYELDEVRGVCIDEIIARGRYVEETKEFARELIFESKTVKAETVRTSKNGRNMDVELLAYPIYLDQDRLGAYAFYRDISDRKNKERVIRELIYRDSLTGIHNRKYAYEILERKLKKAKAENGVVTFLYFDIDDFKKVNDAKGHSFGDLLLIDIAGRIRDQFIGQIEFCRVGGDEFLAIINDPFEAPVRFYIDQLKYLFEEAFTVNCQSVKTDLSIGYASFPEDGTDLDHLIFMADSRMFRQKRISRIRKNPVRRETTIKDLLAECEPGDKK